MLFLLVVAGKPIPHTVPHSPMKIRFSQACFAALLLLIPAALQAHPTPDIPVRTHFQGNGAATVSVEVDPRCLDADPNLAPSLKAAGFQALTDAERTKLREEAGALVSRCVEFFLEPVGRIQPELAFEFTAKGGTPISPEEEAVVLTGKWNTTLASGLTGWRIRSTPASKLSVVFQNVIRGESHPRMAVLFPGESSFVLSLEGLTSGSSTGIPENAVSPVPTAGDGWSAFLSFLRQGFVHVLPEGADHILFVLGLFLLSRNWRPLVAQVTMFTLAHSVTLACATFGWIHAPAAVIEPIIAASIVAIAVENIFHPEYTPWRLVLVFGFGLVHGLGFASALGNYHLTQGALAAGLLGFNAGVESAQLAVIGIALLATVWLRKPELYRRWIVIPGSLAIAAAGGWWTFERLFLA